MITSWLRKVFTRQVWERPHQADRDLGPAIYNRQVFDSLSKRATDFQIAQPFKHIVIDGLFNDALLQQVADAFYACDDSRWQHFENEREGKLAISNSEQHLPSDFNEHPLMHIDRRLNLLIYLNTDWHESYGGHLELWDRTMQNCIQRTLPLFNRTVLFLTDDFSFHGHPDPLTCPPDRMRRSIAMYYYTNGRPASEVGDTTDHDTLFQDRL